MKDIRGYDQSKSFLVGASLVAQMVKNLPTMQETKVRSLGQQDPLEKRMATTPVFLLWRIPGTEATFYGVAKNRT